MVNGKDLVSGKKGSQKDKYKIANFIKSEKPDIFDNFFLKKFKNTENGYETKVLSSKGIYSA